MAFGCRDTGNSSTRVCASAEPGATLELSVTARALMLASSIARAASEVRADRVASLRAQIDSGKYRVDSRALAKVMLES